MKRFKLKYVFATICVALFTAVSSMGFYTAAQASTYGPLVEVEQLSSSLKYRSPILLDIRNKGYDKGHVAGAVTAPYRMFRGPKENPGQLFDLKKLEAELENIGLELDKPIVIITAGNNTTDFGAAARVYWTLKSTGFKDITILNGGLEAWAAAKKPVSKEVPALMPSELDLTFDKTWYASTEDVSNVVNGKSKAILVDSRFEDFYKGKKSHPAATKAGTLPGSINQPYTEFFSGKEKTIQTKIDLASLKSKLGVKSDETVVSFCNTGHWAATHWFATSELAGVKNAKLYPGSMVEYSAAKLPMENVPNWFQNLINQFTK